MKRRESRPTTIIDTSIDSAPRHRRPERPSPDHDFFGSRVNPIPRFLARPMPLLDDEAPGDGGLTVRVRFFDAIRGFGYVIDEASGTEAFLSADILRRDQIEAPFAGQFIRVFIAAGVKGMIVSGVDRAVTERLAHREHREELASHSRFPR